MSKVVEVNEKNFQQEVMDSDLPVEVDFWAPWCGPCRSVSPVYDKLAEEYEGRFKFCKVNVDENQVLAAQFQVRSIPFQAFLADGEMVDELLGAVPEAAIREKVDAVIASHPADAAGRFKALVATWMEHNEDDSAKLKKWMEKAGQGEVDDGALLERAERLQSSSDSLKELLAELEPAL